MKTPTTSSSALATAPYGPSLVEDAYGALTESFEQFCLMAGIESPNWLCGDRRVTGSRPLLTKLTLPTKPHRWLHHALRMEPWGWVLSVLSVLSEPRSPVPCLPRKDTRPLR